MLTISGQLLTSKYGEITKAQTLLKAEQYQAARGRDAQNAEILYNCLMASVADEIIARVNLDPGRFVLEVDGEKINDGTCFLKAIIDDTYTNTLSSATTARENLSSLDSFMEKLPKSDITKLNQHVRENIKELEAANETTTDLVMNLFKGYAKAKDKVFRQWLQRKKDDYITKKDLINPNGLDFMEQVENYYKDRLRSNEWMKLDEDQQTTLALKAQLSHQ